MNLFIEINLFFLLGEGVHSLSVKKKTILFAN